MNKSSPPSNPSIIPTLRYRDGPGAIKWLCKAFGFKEHLVVPDPTGAIAHAQLVYGNSMIMLGSATNNAFGKLVQSPLDSANIGSQSIYIIVQNVDEHYQQAVSAGAKIVIDIKDEEYGGRGYSCQDLEGHVWSFGSYDPWGN